MATPVGKSAAHVLDLLEHFANWRAPAGVSALADALGYPRSSTSVLLASLVAMRYLHQGPRTRQFMPSARVAPLGAWIETDRGVHGQLQKLRERTGETIILAQRNGLDAQYIQVLESTADVRLMLRIGTRRPLVRAATGQALLSLLGDAEIQHILRRCNAEAAAADQVTVRELLYAINQVRARGYAFTESRFTQGGAIIAALMPVAAGDPALAVGVGGATQRILAEREKIVAALHEMGAVGVKSNAVARAARKCASGA